MAADKKPNVLITGSLLRAKVSEANDPPLVGAENDRVPRNGESYVKDFKPMSLGVFALPAGRDMLTLRALQISGKGVMDVRMIELVLEK